MVEIIFFFLSRQKSIPVAKGEVGPVLAHPAEKARVLLPVRKIGIVPPPPVGGCASLQVKSVIFYFLRAAMKNRFHRI